MAREPTLPQTAPRRSQTNGAQSSKQQNPLRRLWKRLKQRRKKTHAQPRAPCREIDRSPWGEKPNKSNTAAGSADRTPSSDPEPRSSSKLTISSPSVLIFLSRLETCPCSLPLHPSTGFLLLVFFRTKNHGLPVSLLFSEPPPRLFRELFKGGRKEIRHFCGGRLLKMTHPDSEGAGYSKHSVQVTDWKQVRPSAV